MNKRIINGSAKHWDFIILDIIGLQFSFIISYWIFHGLHNPYLDDIMKYQALVFFVSQLVVILFSGSYHGILRRNNIDELLSIVRYSAEITILTLIYYFMMHQSALASRLQSGFTFVCFIPIAMIIRSIHKKRLLHLNQDLRSNKSIALFTSSALLSDTMEKLTDDTIYRDFFISSIILLDKKLPEELEGTEYTFDAPVFSLNDDSITHLSHEWIDEVFIFQPDDMPFPNELMDKLMEMGLTVNYTMSAMCNDRCPVTDVRMLGSYRVLTNSMKFVAPGQLAVKRLMDIVGGLVGCILTGIIFIFVAPAIYVKSPGPIFFSQNRIGKNGKIFRIYKFRTMYMDAEERRAELMEKNKIKGDLMFKIDDDPRIIGSEKKDKKGRPKGIGNFLRKTSLDEFPQFYNVLRSEMSLVGWRPATVDEWERYDLKHRIRAGMKPGITGMWQVSGRSEITDFDTVVKLDRTYLENWSLILDIKILIKTVFVVLTGHGAK